MRTRDRRSEQEASRSDVLLLAVGVNRGFRHRQALLARCDSVFELRVVNRIERRFKSRSGRVAKLLEIDAVDERNGCNLRGGETVGEREDCGDAFSLQIGRAHRDEQ